MKEADQEVLDAVFRVRVRNNDLWKKLLEIAVGCAPAETKAVLREIATNDETITVLMRELVQ